MPQSRQERGQANRETKPRSLIMDALLVSANDAIKTDMHREKLDETKDSLDIAHESIGLAAGETQEAIDWLREATSSHFDGAGELEGVIHNLRIAEEALSQAEKALFFVIMNLGD
jgi:hypothetical protein